MPILLFNEADALIGQRMHASDSVDVMNNSMQNILLEELEKFDGIFFATTIPKPREEDRVIVSVNLVFLCVMKI